MQSCTIAALQVQQARHVIAPVRSQLCLRSDTTAALQVWQAWHVVAPIRPQLYLTSQADALIPPAEVSLFMKQQVYGISYNAGILRCEGQHWKHRVLQGKEAHVLINEVPLEPRCLLSIRQVYCCVLVLGFICVVL